jgi:nucleoid DNA-binding protein
MGRSKVTPVRTSQLANEIAWEAGMDPRDVRLVLEHLSDRITRHLAAGERVHLDNFGTISATEMKGITRQADVTDWKKKKRRVAVGKAMRVSFKQASRLKEVLKWASTKKKA